MVVPVPVFGTGRVFVIHRMHFPEYFSLALCLFRTGAVVMATDTSTVLAASSWLFIKSGQFIVPRLIPIVFIDWLTSSTVLA